MRNFLGRISKRKDGTYIVVIKGCTVLCQKVWTRSYVLLEDGPKGWHKGDTYRG